MTGRKTRVLIVDDSAVTRRILAQELAREPGIEVVGSAADPYVARDKILRDNPDVLVLDVEMPRMDGLTFLKKLMKYHPLPVIILSSLTRNGTKLGIEAIECGALEVFGKPRGDSENGLVDLIVQLGDAIRSASCAASLARRDLRPREMSASGGKSATGGSLLTRKVIAIGASTGGTEALKCVLSALPADCPGILAVIHMPAGFTASFAERLNQCCAIEVREAADGDLLRSGLALIARGDRHLVLGRSGMGYCAQVREGPLICRHRPSVEVLFQSVAKVAGPDALGVIMTGMGSDGADGLLAMRKAGAHTVAQDKASCIVFGMPKEAIERGAAAEVLPVDRIAAACSRWGIPSGERLA